jgi:hypothetical protein
MGVLVRGCAVGEQNELDRQVEEQRTKLVAERRR